MVTGDEIFGDAARRGEVTRGVRRDAPATRRKFLRLEQGPMGVLRCSEASMTGQDGDGRSYARGDCPCAPLPAFACSTTIRAGTLGLRPAKKDSNRRIGRPPKALTRRKPRDSPLQNLKRGEAK